MTVQFQFPSMSLLAVSIVAAGFSQQKSEQRERTVIERSRDSGWQMVCPRSTYRHNCHCHYTHTQPMATSYLSLQSRPPNFSLDELVHAGECIWLPDDSSTQKGANTLAARSSARN